MQKSRTKRAPARGRRTRYGWFSALMSCLMLSLFATGTLFLCAEFEQHMFAVRTRTAESSRMERSNSGRVAENSTTPSDEYSRIEESRTEGEGESECRRALQSWRSFPALFCNSGMDLFIPGPIRQVKTTSAAGRQLQSLFTQEIPKRAGPAT